MQVAFSRKPLLLEFDEDSTVGDGKGGKVFSEPFPLYRCMRMDNWKVGRYHCGVMFDVALVGYDGLAIEWNSGWRGIMVA